jgi:hypothetical protein
MDRRFIHIKRQISKDLLRDTFQPKKTMSLKKPRYAKFLLLLFFSLAERMVG